jgi:LuxR family maltose regulon positive regulatory protein
VVAHRAHILLCLHRLEESAEALAEALRWAKSSGLLDSLEGDLNPHLLIGHGRNRAHLNLARLFLARGEREAALGLLARLLPLTEEAGTMNSEIEILALTALARNALGDPAGALEPLRRALALAEPQGFVRIFVDEGREMAELIERAAPGTVSNSYAAALRNAFGPGPAGDPQEAVASSPPPPPEPRRAALPAPAEALSEREIEVLRLIATGLSNAETGRKLFIAPSTVKKHLENIYGKLETGSRTQAIARAREMGLL